MREKRDNRKRHSEKERKKEKQNYILTDFSEWCVSIPIDEFNQCKGEIIADWYQQVELDSACFRFLGRKWLKSDNEFGYIGNPITYLLLSYWVVIWWLGSSPPKKNLTTFDTCKYIFCLFGAVFNATDLWIDHAEKQKQL